LAAVAVAVGDDELDVRYASSGLMLDDGDECA